eukprot:GHVU01230754.1.p4 GENE.GHVU01230754.1~~GHVU01230754.1.p4  ORF type:complete len:126 (+),score=31.33 GHVU01230754.1:1-378(+)
MLPAHGGFEMCPDAFASPAGPRAGVECGPPPAEAEEEEDGWQQERQGGGDSEREGGGDAEEDALRWDEWDRERPSFYDLYYSNRLLPSQSSKGPFGSISSFFAAILGGVEPLSASLGLQRSTAEL